MTANFLYVFYTPFIIYTEKRLILCQMIIDQLVSVVILPVPL
jgi:hypothetical protein